MTKSIALAKAIRLHALNMVEESKSSHIASALSIADILGVLYGDVLRFRPKQPDWLDRDRFILSKGHACSALYGCLAESGFFETSLLRTYGQNDSDLMTHASHKVPGVEFSTGSLGHGLPFGLGGALALTKFRSIARVIVLIGDGELAEGSNWEAILVAAHHGLKNLTLIVDNNNLQSLTTVDATLNLELYSEKFRAFNWDCEVVDGHDHEALKLALHRDQTRPLAIIAKTTKGQGVSFMENKVEWHYRNPGPELLLRAIAEVEGGNS